MSFNLSELIHIVSTLDDSLSMSEAKSNIAISAGYEEDEDNDCTEEFLKLFFSLKNGSVEIKIGDSTGTFDYLDFNGKKLKSAEFDDCSVAEITGSFRKSLKQIWAFDRQNISIQKNTTELLDRASFGLAEVN
jgi:hypothetical protein